MRTNVEENDLFGKIVAEKFEPKPWAHTILVPLQGFSLLDRKGSGHHKMSMDGTMTGEWYRQEADLALINSLKTISRPFKGLIKGNGSSHQ